MLGGVNVSRAGWATGSFLGYAGALLALGAAVAWLGVIDSNHSQGSLAGWSVLFWVVAEVLALFLLARGRRVVGGLFGFVGLGLFAFMVAAFFEWFGWLPHDKALGGFHLGRLFLVLLVLLAAAIDLAVVEPGLASLLREPQAMDAIAADSERIVGAARATLALAGLKPAQLDAMYFTGGSTGLQPLVAAIAAVAPQARSVRGDRFASVATGLGVHARRLFEGATA